MAVGYFEEKTSFSFSLFGPYSGKFVQYIVLVSQEVQIFKSARVVCRPTMHQDIYNIFTVIH